MLNSQKTLALAGLLGSLALTTIGVAQAHEDSSEPKCTRDSNGIHCSQQSETTYTSKDGKTVVVQQSQSCSSYERNRRIGPVPLEGSSSQGSSQSCSNSLPG